MREMARFLLEKYPSLTGLLQWLVSTVVGIVRLIIQLRPIGFV
jgi:hypothetical protein